LNCAPERINLDVMGDTGTFLVTSGGAENIHVYRHLEFGPTQAQIDEITRLALEAKRRRGAPNELQVRAQGLGAKLLSYAIAAGLQDGDQADLDGRVYRLVIKHGSSTDDIDERLASAQIETGTHEVLARGGGLVIQPGAPIGPGVFQQFIRDAPALAQILVRQAVENLLEEQNAQDTGLRRVKVTSHKVGHALIENHATLLLALVGAGITIAIPPLAILGVPWEVEAALGGIASLVAHDAKSARSDDLNRRNQAELVRQHWDIIARAEAIQAFDAWAHDLSKKPLRPSVKAVVMPGLPLPVNAGAATPRVLALS
jgi:hypothetical protein